MNQTGVIYMTLCMYLNALYSICESGMPITQSVYLGHPVLYLWIWNANYSICVSGHPVLCLCIWNAKYSICVSMSPCTLSVYVGTPYYKTSHTLIEYMCRILFRPLLHCILRHLRTLLRRIHLRHILLLLDHLQYFFQSFSSCFYCYVCSFSSSPFCLFR